MLEIFFQYSEKYIACVEDELPKYREIKEW